LGLCEELHYTFDGKGPIIWRVFTFFVILT
jgi:hypothetical protein